MPLPYDGQVIGIKVSPYNMSDPDFAVSLLFSDGKVYMSYGTYLNPYWRLAYDLELTCDQPVATESTDWGKIKGMYSK